MRHNLLRRENTSHHTTYNPSDTVCVVNAKGIIHSPQSCIFFANDVHREPRD